MGDSTCFAQCVVLLKLMQVAKRGILRVLTSAHTCVAMCVNIPDDRRALTWGHQRAPTLSATHFH